MLFSGTESDNLFIYVFLLFPEVQKCCFQALCQIICLCISIISRSPEMLCFLALWQIICLCISIISRSPVMLFSGTVPDYLLFMYFYYFQKSRNVVFRHCARLFVYLCISIISRNVMFSGSVHFARQVHLSGQFLKQTSQCLE